MDFPPLEKSNHDEITITLLIPKILPCQLDIGVIFKPAESLFEKVIISSLLCENQSCDGIWPSNLKSSFLFVNNKYLDIKREVQKFLKLFFD